MNMMRAWLHRATEDERIYLALETGTTRGNLNQYAYGRRNPGPVMAAAIERVTKQMHDETAGRLPVVYRTDLAPACARCDFARDCLGEDVVRRAEFPVELRRDVVDHAREALAGVPEAKRSAAKAKAVKR